MTPVLAVIMPPASRELVSVSDVMLDLGDDVTNGSILQRLIQRASAMCVGYAGRPFGRQTVSETFYLPPFYHDTYHQLPFREVLPLRFAPLAQVASVVEDGTTLAVTTEYQFDAEAGLLYRIDPNGFRRAWFGAAQVVVTYTGGWWLPNEANFATETNPALVLPDDVQTACMETVRALYYSTGANARDPALRSENTQNVGSTSWLAPDAGNFGLPASAAQLLFKYRALA